MVRPTIGAETARAINEWRPIGWDSRDVEAVEVLLPLVRGWVVAAEPSTEVVARRFVRAAAGLALWASLFLGTTDAETVLAPANVEYYTMVACADRAPTWRSQTRWCLRVVGRATNPDGWGQPSQRLGRRAVAEPYSPGVEGVYRLAVSLGARRSDVGRGWVVCGALGAGLRGPELAAAHGEDLVAISGGRVAVRVRGAHARLVPIRSSYTALVLRLQRGAPSGPLVGGRGRNAVHKLLESLRDGDRHGLSLRRSRATWLCAHLTAGTPLGVLRRIAGPLSANTLDALLGDVAAALSEQDAAMGGLGA